MVQILYFCINLNKLLIIIINDTKNYLQKIIFLFFFIFLICIQVSFAQVATSLNVVTTAVPFLRINPDGKASGMADMGIATEADAYSSYYNVAKNVFNKTSGGIGLSYTPWLQRLNLKNIYLIGASGFYKINDLQSVQMSIRYFSLGNIQFTDYAGNILGNFKPNEFAIDGGYSRKITKRLSLGVTLRFIYSNLVGGAFSASGIAYRAGTAVAGDVGIYHNLQNENGQGFTWGLTLSNLGSKIGYTSNAQDRDFIPANLGLGTTYTRAFDENNKLMVGLELNRLLVPLAPTSADNGGPIDSASIAKYKSQSVVSSWINSFSGNASTVLNQFVYSIGAEYRYTNLFAFRAGYVYQNPTAGNRQYVTLGFGFAYKLAGLNFSYLIPTGTAVNQNPLTNTVRFGLYFKLGNENSNSDNPFQQNQ